jgi:hypothetical protein
MTQPSDSKYTPTANQQDGDKTPVGIAQPDGQPQSSEGNQSVKEAVENLHPKDMARNLDPSQPDQQPNPNDQNTAPFAPYSDGTVPDTAKGQDADPSLPTK